MRLYHYLMEPVTTTEARAWRLLFWLVLWAAAIRWVGEIVEAIA